MTFETSYQLEEFRAIQPELFNEDGHPYMINWLAPARQMLELINQMEQEIILLEKKAERL